MFIAVLEQSGGCDYTIACGTKVVNLNAETMEGAIEELSKFDGDEGDIIHYHGGSIDDCDIYEVTDSFDFLAYSKKRSAIAREQAKANKAEADREKRKEDYLKLKEEFEG